MSITDRLARMDSAYEAAAELDPLPLGRHEVTVTASSIVTVDWSTDLQWRIVFANDEGQRTEHVNLERESTLWKVKQTAKRLGYTGDTLSGIATWAPVAVGAKAFIDITETKSKDGEKTYVNANVVKLLAEGKGEPSAPAEPAPSGLDEDIPFAPSAIDNFL